MNTFEYQKLDQYLQAGLPVPSQQQFLFQDLGTDGLMWVRNAPMSMLKIFQNEKGVNTGNAKHPLQRGLYGRASNIRVSLVFW